MAARVTALLVRLSGADQRILRLVPEETSKFASLGGVILTTAALAGLSMLVTLTTIGLTPWVSTPVAVSWSVMVANLDRWLVASLQWSAKRLQTITLIVPRLLISLLLAAVISTPLILRIFEPVIESELAAQGEHVGSGLLARMEALNAVAARDAGVNLAQYTLLILIVLIDLLPVLLRVLTLFGPPSGYDRATAEEENKARAEALRNVVQTRTEVIGLERQVADQLAELLTTLGAPAKDKAGSPSDELDGGRP